MVTIEGLPSQEGRFTRLREAFVRHGAVQCGFCTPGMLVAAMDLLERNPSPDRAQICEGLAGNLCRCTGYARIVDAVEAASQPETAAGQPHKNPGEATTRREGRP